LKLLRCLQWRRGDGSVEDSFFEVVDVVDLFIVVIVLLVNPASRRGTIIKY
jgi:hypothetical protein